MVETIAPERFRKKIRGQETLTLLDLRTPDEFQEDHIHPDRGEAVNVPFHRFKEDTQAAIEDVPRGDPLYIICWTGVCSKRVCELLDARGRNTVSVEGGMDGWRALD